MNLKECLIKFVRRLLQDASIRLWLGLFGSGVLIVSFSPNVSCIVANKVHAALSTTNDAAKQVSLRSLHCCLFDATMELKSGVHPRKGWLIVWLAAQRS